MWIVAIVGFAIVVLAHVAPGRFVLDAMAGDRAVWHMPRDFPPILYLTYDDGPNPTTTPDLGAEGVGRGPAGRVVQADPVVALSGQSPWRRVNLNWRCLDSSGLRSPFAL